MILLPVTPQEAAETIGTWERFVYDLADACNSEPRAFFSDILGGRDRLFLVYDAVRGEVRAIVIGRVGPDGQGRPFLDVTHCTGGGMAEWVDLIRDLEGWAKEQGCAFVRLFARPGWQRTLKTHGYSPTHIVLEKGL